MPSYKLSQRIVYYEIMILKIKQIVRTKETSNFNNSFTKSFKCQIELALELDKFPD